MRPVGGHSGGRELKGDGYRVKGIKKQHLPTKICAACERPFVWRKKWAKEWERVKYCSDRCRNARKAETR